MYFSPETQYKANRHLLLRQRKRLSGSDVINASGVQIINSIEFFFLCREYLRTTCIGLAFPKSPKDTYKEKIYFCITL